jgi:hypothetical protein
LHHGRGRADCESRIPTATNLCAFLSGRAFPGR